MEKSRGSGFFRHLVTAAALAGAVACSAASSTPEGVGTTSSALAIAGLFPTGVDAAGAPLAAGTVDPHYTLSSNDPAFPGPDAIAVAPNPAWTPDTATSSWISIRVNRAGAADALYTYSTTFTLVANPATATLSGSWAADDSVTLRLNGTAVATRPATAYGTVAPFTVPAGSPFVVGANTLAFVTVNSGGGPTGLQVVTLAGNVAECTTDAQCTAAQFCDTTTDDCTAKLANGTAVPVLTGHTPPLTGVCTVAVGASVCVSGVCDTKDNLCGFADGDGPCVAGVAAVCRSGVCSVAQVCEPVGGCETDADCAAGLWCDESTTTCTSQLVNGMPVPTDPPHTNPTLNGVCTVAAAALVCASGVCDTNDNECGFANGDGPCTTVDGPVVCRSGACSLVDVCEPAGGCVSDADCTGGRWCDETTATCTAKLANGTTLPIDVPHTNPTLDGECIPAAAALVCVSGVCDIKDNRCGLANGDGPCTSASAGTVCRSLACSVDGTCDPPGGCNVDGDCTAAAPDCDTTTHACVVAPDAGTGEAGAGDAGLDGGGAVEGGSPAKDAGTDGGGAVEGGSPAKDAGEGGISPEEAGSLGDASATPEGAAGSVDSAPPGSGSSEAATDGYLDGGGLSCAISATGRGDASAVGGLAAMMALAGVARRRRRVA
jgi:MYXO-CTERM domain-containing protein